MKASEQIVVDTFVANSELWEKPWRDNCIRQLATVGRRYITQLLPLQLDIAFDLLDDPAARSSIVDVDQAVDAILSNLCAPGGFRDIVKDVSKNANVGVARQHQVEVVLRPLVTQTLDTAASDQILVSIPPSEIYRKLADLLSVELFEAVKRNSEGSENVILERALLIYYLRRWQMPCGQLRRTLQLLSQGRLGLRGSLLSIQNRHYGAENGDQFDLPVHAWPALVLLSGLDAHSAVLSTIVSEAAAIPAQAGFFHKAMDPSNPVDAGTLALSPNISVEMVREARDLAYRQYEYTSLIFMIVIGIEYVLRTHCATVQTGQASLQEVLEASDYLPDTEAALLEKVLGTDGWNIRNRSLHGSFLEIEGRRVELMMHSGIYKSIGVPELDLSGDGSLLENVAAFLLQVISDLTATVSANNCPSNASWTNHFLLTESEMQFGEQVHCDLLDNIEVAEAWRQGIRNYLLSVTPCLSVPLQEGLRSWFSPPSTDTTLPGFSYLMLLFEPFLRLTLHMAGLVVTQGDLSKRGDGEHYRLQYTMLDCEGLLSPDNISWLTSHLNSSERPVAERTLSLAMKCRNAFAHGAVTDYSEKVRTVYGHLVVKAIQLVT